MAKLMIKCASRALFVCIILAGVITVLLIFIIPFVFRFFPSLERRFILIQNEESVKNEEYINPENVGFIGARNFYLTTEDGARLGVWHTLPSNLEVEAKSLNLTYMDSERAKQIYNDWLVDATVFLHIHATGSSCTRTSYHRLRIYKLLNSLNYHVITFDYRGYGDSTGSPTSETDLVEDTLAVFAWINDRVVTGNIFMWGHSLGTGVAAHASVNLLNKGDQVDGIVLEAAFNNMADAFRFTSIGDVVSFLPWFNYCFIQPLYENDLSFETDKYLKTISTPVLILHAKDDQELPYELAAKLYESLALSRKDPSSIRLVGYDRSLRYGHNNIALDPNLSVTIKQFVERSFH